MTAADGLYKKLGALVLHHSLGALKSKSGKTEEWGVGLANMVEQYINTKHATTNTCLGRRFSNNNKKI